ncbi:MAG TPA: DUF3105 domain-containing protein [Candidatus Limnocylindria bacterium]|nr:DUF3105 domain-containing protein [Candidatus Limnocylindria bacterium]
MTVTTRRERRQQQRRQQQRRSSGGGGGSGSRGLGQLWVALGIVVVLVALVLVGRASGVFDAPAQTKTDVNAVDVSGAKIGEHRDNTGNAHIPTGQKASYASLPPTSGEHYAAPAGPVPWGIKTTFIPFEATTHNLEHGGIVIMYNGLDKTQVDQLTSLVRSLNSSGFNKIVLEPWPDMKDAKIILTAWDWVLKLQAPDDASVVKFVRQHTDDEAPENGTP